MKSSATNPAEADVEALFADFVPLQLECIVAHSTVIDGVAETVARLRHRGIKIGSTTGYTRPMLDLILGPPPSKATSLIVQSRPMKSAPDAPFHG